MKKTKMRKLMKLGKRKRRARKKKIRGVYIPGDIVREILLRLPARCLGKYRCVCKSWLSITTNPTFVRANAQLGNRRHSSVIPEDLTRPTKLRCDSAGIGLREYQQATKSIPKRSLAIASCDGLVCVLRFKSTKYQYYIINPLTGQSFSLPIDDNAYLTTSMGFYFHPTTSTYRLIRFKKIKYPLYVNEILVIGESSWRRIPHNPPAFLHCEYPLDLNGNIYWLAFSRSIISQPRDTVVIFDEEQEVYSVISLPPALEKVSDFGRMLFDFNGELGLSVLGQDNTIDVWIIQENFWIKRYSVNYDHINTCPSRSWDLRGAVIIGDEELLVRLSSVCGCIALPFPMPSPTCEQPPNYLVLYNLKSGACVVQEMMPNPALNFSIFSYTETLTNPQHF